MLTPIGKGICLGLVAFSFNLKFKSLMCKQFFRVMSVRKAYPIRMKKSLYKSSKLARQKWYNPTFVVSVIKK